MDAKYKKLTKKQKGFVKDYVKTGNGQESVLRNYNIKSKDKENVARSMASENLMKPNVAHAIQSIAEQIPDELLVEKHLELLNKRDLLTGIDTQAVKAGLDMAYKLKGSYAAERKELTGKDGKEIVFMPIELLEKHNIQQEEESNINN